MLQHNLIKKKQEQNEDFLNSQQTNKSTLPRDL